MRVILCGRLRQRSFGTGTGEKRTVTEVEVEEIGLSLRYATAARRLCRPGNSNQNPVPPAEVFVLGEGGEGDIRFLRQP